MAITSCPTRSRCESPSGATASSPALTRSTAMSVSGSSPTRSASCRRPSWSTTLNFDAPCTTWLLVSTKPSGVNTNPEPPPSRWRPERPRRACDSTLTTAGATRSVACTTAREYASNSSPSSGTSAFEDGVPGTSPAVNTNDGDWEIMIGETRPGNERFPGRGPRRSAGAALVDAAARELLHQVADHTLRIAEQHPGVVLHVQLVVDPGESRVLAPLDRQYRFRLVGVDD